MADPVLGSLQGPPHAHLTPPMGNTTLESAQRTFRPRSDSLDIFTMSPLSTPPFDAYSNTNDIPSTPQLRLPDPPALELDLGLKKADDGITDTPYCLHYSSSSPNSPTPFSFSPPRRADYQQHYGAHPFEPRYGSSYGGTSYSTDMTSLIGSWENKEQCSSPSVSNDDKGKSVPERASVEESLPSKGKGKAVDSPLLSSSASRASFEFEFDFQHQQDFTLDLNAAHSDADVSYDDASESPVVRLSPASHYRQVMQGTEPYAGPSSRNGGTEIFPVEAVEDVAPVTIPSTPLSSASSLPRITPPPPSSMPPFRSMNEIPPHPHLPTHSRSFSSLSLRSIRSSSSRSIASLRLTGAGLRGKVMSMAPAAKKIKGGLRKMFKRHSAGASTTAAGMTSSDEDESDEEEPEPSAPAMTHLSDAANETTGSHQLEPSNSPNTPTHNLEASSDSQATVTHLVASGIVHVPENITEEPGPGPPAMSCSIPKLHTVVSDASELGGGQNRDVYLDMAPERQPKVERAGIEVLTVQPNHFNDKLPRELQLAVLRAMVSLYAGEHARAENGDCEGKQWSVHIAGKTRWVGRNRGLRELVKLTRVSKTWQALAFDGQLWGAMHVTSTPPHLSPALLLRLAGHAGSFVRSLDLRGWTHLDPVTFRALVRSLSLVPAPDVIPSPLESAASVTTVSFLPTNLSHVVLRTCTSLTTHSLHHVLLRAPNLCSVDLRGLSAVTNTTCRVLSAHCLRLEIADLGRCPNMDGDGLRELVGDCTLARTWTSDEGDLPIACPNVAVVPAGYRNTRLRVLKASGLKRSSVEALAALGKGALDLEVLDLSGSRDLTDGAIEAFVMWEKVWETSSFDALCPRKVELSAREVGRDPAADSGPFFKRITHLRHLNLSSCPLLTDAACTHVAHCVPRLEFLELAGIGPELKDNGLVRLLGTTPLLRRLDLEDASDITDAVLEVLATSPPVEVRKRGVIAPPPPPGDNLEHLVISCALGVTNEALLTLINACSRLTVLECDNTRVSGTVLKEFVRLAKQRRLRGAEIVAVDCRSVTEALVRGLSSQTRARKGYRHYEARLLGYVDARDKEDLGAIGVVGGTEIDDCDDTRVALKSFWSWQSVDAVRQMREKRRKLALSTRRNINSSVLGEDTEDFFGLGGAGPSTRPRWLSHWTRTSGSGSSSPTGVTPTNEEERGCVLM